MLCYSEIRYRLLHLTFYDIIIGPIGKMTLIKNKERNRIKIVTQLRYTVVDNKMQVTL